MQARFRWEAQAAAELSCDHIVQVNDFGCAEDGSLFLVMELLEGENLRGTITPDRSPRLRGDFSVIRVNRRDRVNPSPRDASYGHDEHRFRGPRDKEKRTSTA